MNFSEYLARARKLAAGIGLTIPNLAALVTDLRVGIGFYTCLPLPLPGPIDGAAFARATWCAPLVGALIGALAAFGYWAAVRLNLPPFVAATLALATSLLVTGCLHEDGLADTADGLGGATRERALDIMRDGRIGTYGTCAVAIALVLRIGALFDLEKASLVAPALIGAHAAARGALPLFMRLVPPARNDGLSASAGAPAPGPAAAAALIGFALLATTFGLRNALIALVLMCIGAAVMAWLCRRRFGGQTGDVLGALEQVGECLVLLVTAARF
jgi:adenosylcobinamide-GDP ribazoletransferase